MTLFERDNMLMAIQGTTQKEVLAELAAKAKELGIVADESQLIQDYLDREAESTTGFGNGVAIPHAKTSNNLKAGILFGRSDHPVEWDSLDGKPVETWISLIVPDQEAGLHLQLLAQLSRQLVHPEFVTQLKQGTQEEVFTLISNIVNA